jgi:hypothetical protein
MMIWAYRRKGAVGLLLALFLNWIGWIIVLCLPRDDKRPEREREREQLSNLILSRLVFFSKSKKNIE